MKPFIVLVLVVCVGIYIIYLAWNIDDIMKKKKHIKIKFRSFKEFYVVAPEKWDLQKDFVRYRYSENFKYKNCEILLSAEKYQYFRFSWLDTIRYRRYKKYLKKKINEQEKDIVMTRFLREVQRDINKWDKEYIKYLKNKVDSI